MFNHQSIPQMYRIFMVPQAMPQATIGNYSSPLRFLCVNNLHMTPVVVG